MPHFNLAEVQALEDQLEAERSKSNNLADQVSRLKKEVQDTTQRARQSEAKEKDLLDRFKDQVRRRVHCLVLGC